MRKSILAVAAAAALVAAPTLVAAQGIGVAGRGGTLGVGAEGALSLTDNFVVRGGVGLMPFEPSTTIDDIEFTLFLPDTWFNLGADLYLGGGFRIGGGILFKSDDPSVEAVLTGQTDIGGTDYSAAELGTMTGVFDSKDQAPYVLIGFGKHTSSGIGLFLDLGVAVVGDPEIRLDASGGTVPANIIRADLDRQEAELEEDIGTYLKYWPILNVGIKIGLGG